VTHASPRDARLTWGRREGAKRLYAALLLAALLAVLAPIAGGCASQGAATGGALRVVATTSFLRDIAQHVAAGRFTVRQLIPDGADPHAFEPAPSDLRAVAGSDLLIVNGGGLEGPLLQTLKEVGGGGTVVTAAAGIPSRTPKAGEPPLAAGELDPHYWLDPTLVERYVATIRDAYRTADPKGAAAYDAAARDYVAQLRRLDRWIRARIDQVPAARRILVTDHASLGYYADRYGIRIAGTVIPSVTSGDTPTARQLADLTATIRRTGVRAIVVDAGENPQLARQIAGETGVSVVTDLLDHTLTAKDGPAPTYIAMMKYDTLRLVAAMES
jgi:ABC-type Zn uptake system ZnuABC Zn-binding protein ZnuA